MPPVKPAWLPSKTLAREHSRHNVTFNVVCPGPTDTALLATVTDAASNPRNLVRRSDAQSPIGRLGQPEDLAGAILFFASDAARSLLQVSASLVVSPWRANASYPRLISNDT